jgi:hypothetical protein
MIMLMGRDYVCDLHEEPWWNDINRVKLPIHPPELSGSTTNSLVVAKQKN